MGGVWIAMRPNWSKQHQGHHQALWTDSLHRDWPLTRPRSVGEEGTRSSWVQPSGYGGQKQDSNTESTPSLSMP